MKMMMTFVLTLGRAESIVMPYFRWAERWCPTYLLARALLLDRSNEYESVLVMRNTLTVSLTIV